MDIFWKRRSFSLRSLVAKLTLKMFETKEKLRSKTDVDFKDFFDIVKISI